jgi:hypothetical protein
MRRMEVTDGALNLVRSHQLYGRRERTGDRRLLGGKGAPLFGRQPTSDCTLDTLSPGHGADFGASPDCPPEG